MTSKTRIKAISAVSLFALAASSGALAQDQLIVSGPGGSTEKILREKVFRKFEAEHKLKVTYVAGNSTDILAKLQAQKEQQEIDVAMIDDGPMSRAVSLGLCAQITGIDFSKLYSAAAFPEKKASGFGLIATGLMYNKQVFEANGWTPPKSWGDLKDPKFEGKVVIPPMNNGYGLLTVVMLARMNGGGEKNIDPGFDAMQKDIDKNVLAYEPSPAKMTELFQTGQAVLGVWGSSRAQSFAATGFPVDFVYPAEGAPAVMVAICPVAKATASSKAQAFIETILSREVQEVLANEAGLAPVRKDAIVATPGMMPYGEKANQLVTADWEAINEHRDEWNKRWTREVER
ncbi:ABC transporter substrate-binding protein [Ensifer sp. YR511]|uniref:ABC transporter substrate-binding protein n=1 Tax=Ensifer sp. YR511 TaxID=1855294 RepID=UPI00088ACC61|nr:ABC transporter substrate-binding protein [Ensifer sp. YR511]SDO06010.1 putative spermidine/putrescine transport system substrate-binding protein [Ensifer sp. YR511]